MSTWTVYCHTHTKSGRRYIGLTSQTMMKRWHNHVNVSNNSKNGRWHFPNAIRKYGKDAFEHTVLQEGITSLEQANRAEEFAIELFCTRDPLFGFNIARGGAYAPRPVRNPWDRPEFRARNLPRSIALLASPAVQAAGKLARNTDAFKANMACISKEVHARPEVKANDRAAAKLAMTDQRKQDLSLSAKALWRNPEYVKSASKKYQDPVYLKKISEPLLDHEIKKRALLAAKTACSTDEHRKKQSKIMKEVLGTPEARKEKSEKMKKVCDTPEFKARSSANMKLRWQDPEFRAKMAKMSADKWKDKAYRNKVVESLTKQPSNPLKEV